MQTESYYKVGLFSKHFHYKIDLVYCYEMLNM